MIDLEAIRRLSDIPRAQARARGGQPAILHGEHTTTFAALEARSNQVAQALLALGAQPGERVCVLARNCDRFFELFFGAAKARACLTPINFRLAQPEIAYILRDAGARLLFVGDDQFDVAERVAAESETPVRLIALTGEREGWERFDDWSGGLPAIDPALDEGDDDDVLQLYTSGTTGHPKGVVLSNRNYRRFLETSSAVDGFDYQSDETLMIVMPLFHVAGVNVSCAGLAHGCRTIIVRDFVPARALEIMQDEAVAHTFIAPAMILMLLQSPGIAETDFSTLRTIAYGASPISEEVLSRAKAAFGCGFVQYYGMTETTGGGTYLSPGDHDRGDKLRSCGRPWPDTEAAILGPDGAPVSQGEVGEIAIRGDCVMKGYWNRPEATAAAIRDGWMMTGDAGYQDADGYFHVHDRMKDMIITGGENVYPAEVENALFGAPGVADVAVIGVPSERWGEEVKAIVVAEPGETGDPAAIIAWARERIAGFKAPKSVDFVAALPRNASGKVLRRELRDRYWSGRDRRVS
jgi:acyl-CoA synthetase (AMP-forming)/AMP-acid ligase II